MKVSMINENGTYLYPGTWLDAKLFIRDYQACKVVFACILGRTLVCARDLRFISGICFSVEACQQHRMYCAKLVGAQTNGQLLFVDVADLKNHPVFTKKFNQSRATAERDARRRGLLEWAMKQTAVPESAPEPEPEPEENKNQQVLVDIAELISIRNKVLYLKRHTLKAAGRSDEELNLVKKSNSVLHGMVETYQQLEDRVNVLIPTPKEAPPLLYYSIGDYNKVRGIASEIDDLSKEGKERLVRMLGSTATALSKKLNVSIGSEPVGKFARDHFDYDRPTRNTYREDVLKQVYDETFGQIMEVC